MPTGTTGTGIHNDGGLVFGSQVLTIPTGGAVTYIAKNIKINRPTALIESPGALGEPGKEALVEKNFTGTATLSILDIDTKAPAVAAAFTVQPRGGVAGTPIAALNCKIVDNGENSDQNAEGTFEVTFRGQLH
jgi:hypothetical protein